MARKKDKIRVDLELPKDDKTQSNFIAILVVGMLLGICCLGFWITNADLLFKPVNGNPMFINMVCPDSFDANDPNDGAQSDPIFATSESMFRWHAKGLPVTD